MKLSFSSFCNYNHVLNYVVFLINFLVFLINFNYRFLLYWSKPGSVLCLSVKRFHNKDNLSKNEKNGVHNFDLICLEKKTLELSQQHLPAGIFHPS